LDQLQAHLSTLMTYRVAADVLAQMFRVGAGNDPERLRRHTLKIGEVLRNDAVAKPETAVAAITVALDSTFIRNCEDGERHLKVRVGNVETESAGRQVFGAVAKSASIVFARSCIIFSARQMGERLPRPPENCGPALHALDGNLTGQSDWMVNYAERHRAGLRVGSPMTEGTANFLVNRRISELQQMRWCNEGRSSAPASLCCLQWQLGSGFGQRFQPTTYAHRWPSPHDPKLAAAPTHNAYVKKLDAPAPRSSVCTSGEQRPLQPATRNDGRAQIITGPAIRP
jgi:hypothetical protein